MPQEPSSYELKATAKNVLEVNMGMDSSCRLFIIYDNSTERIAEAYVAAAREIQGPDEMLSAIKIREEERPINIRNFNAYAPVIDSCFSGADNIHKIALTPTRQHPGETPFRIALIDYLTGHFGKIDTPHRARLGHQPGINMRMMSGPMKANYGNISKDAEELYQLVKNAKEARLKDANGTNLVIGLPGPDYWEKDDGIMHKESMFGNLPAGELFCDPTPENCEGTLVFKSVTGIGVPETPVKLVFRKGVVEEVECALKGEGYHKMLMDEFGDEPANRTIGELGIGLNPMARLFYENGTAPVREMLEAEKVRGTVHVATGKGRKNSGATTHNDYLIEKPILEIDGEMLIFKGRHVWKNNSF